MNETTRKTFTDVEQDVEQAFTDPIAQNVSDVVDLENKALERLTPAQRWLEAASRRIARPAYLLALLIFVLTWIALNLKGQALRLAPFDPPPFHWLQGLLTLTALLTTTIVLIGQGQLSKLAEQRAHLDLQINLLTEQKVSKLIHLIEELRADLPGVRDRHDPHASQLKKPTDAAQLASALQEKDALGASRQHIESDK
jgi:uncharacterized membrane protein